MRYLDGENLCPMTKEKAISLIGKPIIYLQKRDIDKSGRGYYFPRSGYVKKVYRGNLVLENFEHLSFSSLVEVVAANAAIESTEIPKP